MDPFVTSAFQRHSLTAAVDVMSSIIGGLSKLPIAKILDTWGRPQGLALTLFIWVMGLIMMAGCQNVETYAAAKVFSSVGYEAAPMWPFSRTKLTTMKVPGRVLLSHDIHC